MRGAGQCGVACAARKLQALYHIRPTDGSEPTTVGWSGQRRSRWRCNGQTLVQRSGGLELLFFPFKDLKGGRPETKEKELNCHRFEDFAAVKTVGACCIVSKLTRMPNVRATFRMRPKIMRLTSHCRAESRAGTPCNSFCLQRRRANHRALESDALP